MKKFFLLPILILLSLTDAIPVLAQVAPCPSISATSATLSCTTPCATVTAMPTATIAATNTYSVSAITFAPFAYTGTAWTMPGGAGWSTGTDDNYGKIINLPFNFCFFGNSFSSIVIGTNGNISFNAAANAGGYDPWSISGPLLGSVAGTPSLYNNIMGCWQDTYVGGGPITYATYGTAPCRQFVISWDAVDLYLPGTYCTGTTMTSQIVLYESSNIIDIYIAHRASCSAWNNGYATTAIVNAAGTVFYTPASTPSENGTTFNATNLAWRFTPTGATGGWTYNWTGPGSGTSLGTAASITVCPSVTTTYTVTATSTACSGFSMSATSTVTTTTFLNPITGNTIICAGTTTTLSDATASGTWSSSNPSVATVGLTTGVVGGVSGGTATITYGQGGCASYATVTVIDPGPISGTTSVCPGGSVALTDNPAGGTWSSTNTGVATVGLTSGIVTGVDAGNTIITYTVGPGCTATMPFSVIILSPISGTTTVCQGSNVTLSDSAPGGTWSSNDTGVATIGLNSGVVGGVSQGAAVITYTVGGGCYATTTVTVYPDLPITGPTSECQRWTSITLSDPVSGGTWTSGNVSVATVTPATGTVYGVTPGSGGSAVITYTTPHGCIENITVTINPTPNAPGVTPFTVCQFLPMGPLGPPLAPTGPDYVWYGPGVTAGSTTPPTPQTAVPGTDSFYVTYTSPFGCISDSSLMMVYVTAKPDTPATITSQYCQFYQTPAALDSQVSNYTGTLTWYQGGLSLGNVAPVPPDSTYTYPGYNVYYVTQTVNGCQSDSAAVPVRIIPTPSFDIAHRDWVCQNDSITLSYLPGSTPLVDSAYMWTVPPGAFFVNGTNAMDSSVMVQFDSATTNNYVTLTVSNLFGECATTATIRQDVTALPSADATSKADVCPSDTVTIALSSTAHSPTSFVWYVDTTPLTSSSALTILSANSNSGGPYTIQWNDTGMHIIHVQAYAEHGCTDKPSADTVEVHPLPNATFIVSPLHSGTLCLEDSVLFTASDESYADNYYWTPEHYFNNDDKRTIWGRVQEAQSIVTLKVTNPFGCVATWSMELDPSVCCNVPFPSAFTPNGDGKNDLFRPVPQLHEFHTYHVFRVQNRWGQTVFETTNNKAEWDGTFNGVPCDLGVYYYYLKYDCNGKTLEEKGDVTLIR